MTGPAVETPHIRNGNNIILENGTMDRNYYLIALLSIIFFSMYFGAPELTKAPLASATLVTQSTLVREGVNVD